MYFYRSGLIYQTKIIIIVFSSICVIIKLMDPTQFPIQSPPQTPPEVSIPQPKPNYLKTIILSVLIITTLGLIAYLFFQNQKLQKQVLNPQVSPTIQIPSPTSKPSSSISISPDETAGWKTYINNKLGIEFMYPVEWSEPKESLQSINFNEKLVIVKSPFYDQILQRDLNFNEYSVRSYGDETPRHDFNIDGLIGKRGLEKSVSNYSDIIILAKNNKSTEIISITYIYNPKKEDGKLFNQILSTFKFTDNTNVCVPTYQVETNSEELTAEQNYSVRCTEQRSEKDCLSVDIYNQKAGDFSVPDQISDCIWKNPTI